MQVSKLLKNISNQSPQHQPILLRLAVVGLEGLAHPPPKHQLGTEEEFAARYPFLQNARDRSLFLGFAAKIMLYQPPALLPRVMPAAAQNPSEALGQLIQSSIGGGNPLARGPSGGSLSRGSSGGAPGPIPTPPGLAKQDVGVVEGKAAPSVSVLQKRKLGILNFTAAAGMDPNEALLLYLIAAADPQDAVSRRGEELLRKRCGLDSPKPSVNLEDPALISKLFHLFQGSPEPQAASTTQPAAAAATAVADSHVLPAGVLLQSRLMSLFTKSTAAANHFPGTIQVILSCVYGPTTTARLKQQGMEFAVWVFKHAEDAQLQPHSATILQKLLQLLNEDSAASDTPTLTLRGFTYQALGQLAKRSPQLFQKDSDIAAQFFSALSVEPPGVRAALQEAVSTLASAYKDCSGDAAARIEQLLLGSITSPQEASRLCSAQWANRLFPFQHVPARYICMLATGDAKLEIREEGQGGLNPPKPQPGAPQVQVTYPPLAAMVAYIQSRHAALKQAANSPRGSMDMTKQLPLAPKAYLALIAFLRECRSKQEAQPDAPPQEYLGILEHAMVKDAPGELHVAAIQAMLEVGGDHPHPFAALYQGHLTWLKAFLSHTDATARDAAGKLCGIVMLAVRPSQAETFLTDLTSAFADQDLKKHKFELQDGHLAATGYVLAQSMTGQPAISREAQQQATTALSDALTHSQHALAATAAAALGHAGLRGALPLPQPTPASSSPPHEKDSSMDVVPPSAKRPRSPDGGTTTTQSGGASAGNGAVEVVDSSEAATSDAASASDTSVMPKIVALMKDKDVKVVQKAATAAGHICAGHAVKGNLDPALEGLFALGFNKNEDVLFTVGEALCFAFGGVPVSADIVLRSSFLSIATWLNSKQASSAADASEGPQDMDTDSAQPLTASTSGEAGSEQSAAQDEIIKKVMQELVFHSRAEVRCAGCVWLLSLVSYTGKHPKLMPLLPEIQEAFSHLLGDQNELTQEMASRGMSVVYSLGDESAQKQLLDGLMGVLQGGARKKRAVKLTGETQVFEEGSMGEAPGGGSLSTYKELCALATDMGQPDLVYRFMDLANHHASLNSSRGAAFGFASIAKLAGEQLGPYIANLVPKLYRYQYDPNARVRDSMSHIWRALVAEPKKTVDEHFGAILKELLKEMGGRLWRNREASCNALSDLLQGRRWPELKPWLSDIWSMVLRAVDDIKESVRAAAAVLVKTLRNLTLRLCDPQVTPPGEAGEAVGLALPLMLEKGVTSQVAEVRGLALDTIAKMVKAAGPPQIQPHLADLSITMLESLSGMEDSRLNYVEQHAERIGLDSDKLESLRVSASKASPMGDTLDLCARYADSKTLEEMVPKLCGLVKRGIGLNTRTGCARFITALTTRQGADIKPHTAAFIKALVTAARAEKSTTVQRAYAQAAATVAKYSSEARVAKLVEEAVSMYTTPGDREARLLSSMIIRELQKQAAEAFAGQASQVMPLAFIAKSDEDPGVGGLWGEIWEEGTTSLSAALRLYMPDLVPLITAGLTSQQWGQKKAAAKSLADLAEAGGDALPPHTPTLISTILQELPGRLWEGKEGMLAALAALCKAAPQAVMSSSQPSSSSEAVVEALMTALARKKQAYRQAALEALQVVLEAFSQEDHFEAVAGPLLGTPLQHTQAASSSTQAGKEEEEAEDKERPLPLLPTLKALLAAWSAASSATAAKHAEHMAGALKEALQPGFSWQAHVAALQATQALTTKLQGSDTKQLSKENTTVISGLIPGVLRAAQDVKIAQLQTTALDTLAAMLKATSGGKALPSELRAAIQQQLSITAAEHKSSAVKARAIEIKACLNDGNSADAPMKDAGAL
ncbi:hypothetical protein ABBQ32_002606 [Trebouxia sp. C0010 RCD-2024]